MNGIRIGVGLLALAASAPAAAAEDWPSTLTPEAVGSYLDEGRPPVLVAPAGTDADPGRAASALRKALRASGRAGLVMDTSSLGDVSELPDKEIVKKAAGLPVEVIAVVRVFPGAEGKETLVATLYDKQGKTLAALSVERGTPLARNGEAEKGGLGVSRAADSAVSKILHEGARGENKTRSAVEVEYERRHVGFYRIALIHLNSGLITGHWGGPYINAGGHALDPGEFYEAVDRPDHAAFYRRKSKLKFGIVIPSVLVMLGGVAVATTGALFGVGHPFCRGQDQSGFCIDQDKSPNYGILGGGLAMFAVGLAGTIVGGMIERYPTSEEEAYELAAKHNRKLRKELGLPEDQKDEDIPEQAQRGASLQLVPSIAANGGGLSLRIDF